MKRWIRILVVIIALGALLFFILTYGTYKLLVKEVSVKPSTFLILPIQGEIIEYEPFDVKGQILYRHRVTIKEILDTIDKAKVDKRISGIIVKINPLFIGWAQVEEIRDKLIEFKRTGKMLVSYLEYGDVTDKEYYLATASDKIYAKPGGFFMIDGLTVEVVSIRGMLDKLMIVPNIEQVGEYKGAEDTIKHKRMSKEYREMLNSILDDKFEQLISEIAVARKKSKKEIKNIINNAEFIPKYALKHGLIDKLVYMDELEKLVKKANKGRFNKIEFEKYRRVTPQSLGLHTGEKLALIYATGAIMPGESEVDPLVGEIMGADTISDAIKEATHDDTIKAIILRIDSSGGSGLASDIIWRSINLAKKKKPVIVSMGNVAASGGYYIAMNADRIVAQEGTITGSIGIYAGKLNIKGFYEKLGLNKEVIKRGKYADIFSEIRDFTEEEKKKIKDYLWYFYMDEFVEKVASGRGMKKEEAERIARGRIWTGKQAKKVGLVDELGGLDKAIEIAKELANIRKEESCQIEVYPRPKGIFEELIAPFIARLAPASWFSNTALSEEVKNAIRLYNRANILADDRILLIMPYEIRIH